jgi:hypothetical protein
MRKSEGFGLLKVKDHGVLKTSLMILYLWNRTTCRSVGMELTTR